MTHKKIKIVLDGTVLGMAIDNKLARTGIYFVIKNLCDSLLLRDDVDLKIVASPELKKKLLSFYKGHKYELCLDSQNLKFGKEKLNFIMPYHPAHPDLYKVSNLNLIQIIYDFSFHFCPELKKTNINFEKKIINSLNPKSYALCISEKTKSDLLSISNLSPSRVGVFYPGLRNDLQKLINNNSEEKNFNVHKFLDIPEDSQYVLCLSTIEPRKNLKTSLETFQTTVKNLKSKNLYLILTGARGWDKLDDYLKNLEPETKEKIRVTGYVEDRYIYKLYKSSLCFLYPSFYEGFGLPPLEAMACGVPVITSNRGSLPEIFGKFAKIFDPYDVGEMSKMIIYWHSNPEARFNEIEKIKIFVELFTWKRSCNQIIEFIKKFI
jgi:glycosyltransferase involved in cell wall biosynthesis